MDLDRHDVFSWLLEEHRAKQQVSLQDELDLCGDAYLIVVAGRFVCTSLLHPRR